MKKLIHIHLCWLLTLSITGLPLFSVSVNASSLPDEEACEHVTTTGQNHHSDTTLFISAIEKQVENQVKASCVDCDSNCSCAVSQSCHANNNHQTVAIITIDGFESHPFIIKFSTLASALFHSRDSEPEITPPIV